MTIDLCWQSLWDFVKDYQTVVVFSIGAVVWLIKSLVAHRFIPWLRCILGLHRWGQWQHEDTFMFGGTFPTDDIEHRMRVLRKHRSCNDCEEPFKYELHNLYWDDKSETAMLDHSEAFNIWVEKNPELKWKTTMGEFLDSKEYQEEVEEIRRSRPSRKSAIRYVEPSQHTGSRVFSGFAELPLNFCRQCLNTPIGGAFRTASYDEDPA